MLPTPCSCGGINEPSMFMHCCGLNLRVWVLCSSLGRGLCGVIDCYGGVFWGGLPCFWNFEFVFWRGYLVNGWFWWESCMCQLCLLGVYWLSVDLMGGFCGCGCIWWKCIGFHVCVEMLNQCGVVLYDVWWDSYDGVHIYMFDWEEVSFVGLVGYANTLPFQRLC